ncbi:hypothetical protein E2562_035253 [Oryza meyeriana var. granulata]|uniref:Uncharacterized protein n=1 Tax=Oryza meyeriana var. granulata TaxID=110450 RepID=A0A6G1F1M8_9ORYZ|nr:hypothetical protein E2562_035253 [Oryza meyeriana var. granulata]
MVAAEPVLDLLLQVGAHQIKELPVPAAEGVGGGGHEAEDLLVHELRRVHRNWWSASAAGRLLPCGGRVAAVRRGVAAGGAWKEASWEMVAKLEEEERDLDGNDETRHECESVGFACSIAVQIGRVASTVADRPC